MLLLLGAVISAILAVPAVVISARRNAAQPLEFASSQARDLVRLIANDPASLLRLRGETDGQAGVLVTQEAFTNAELGYAWGELVRLVEASGLNAHATLNAREIDSAVVAARAGTTCFFSNLKSAGNADARLSEALATVGVDIGNTGRSVEPATTKDVVKAGSAVISAVFNQELTTDRAPVEPTGDLDAPYRRVVAAPRGARFAMVVPSAAIATAAACAGMASISFLSTWSMLAAVAFVTGAVVVSLVDWDTFYVDYWGLCLGAAGFWAFHVAAAGSWSRVSTGVIATVVIVVFFEVLNGVWLLLRGKRMGGGDTWIAALSVGAAAAVTGTAMGAIVALVAGCFSMIGYWLVLRVRDGAGADVAVAFGPHLMVGWPVAVALAGVLPA